MEDRPLDRRRVAVSTESHLHFTNRAGDKVWRLPYDMTADFAAPELVEP